MESIDECKNHEVVLCSDYRSMTCVDGSVNLTYYGITISLFIGLLKTGFHGRIGLASHLDPAKQLVP